MGGAQLFGPPGVGGGQLHSRVDEAVEAPLGHRGDALIGPQRLGPLPLIKGPQKFGNASISDPVFSHIHHNWFLLN